MKKVTRNQGTEKPGKGHTAALALGAVIVGLVFFLGGFIFGTENSAFGPSSAEMEKLKAVREILDTKWYYADSDTDTRLLEQAMTGMTTLAEDPHTNYFSLEQAQAFSQSLSGSNVGIGFSFFLNEDNQMVVQNVFVNSSADTSGLQPEDVIVQVGEHAAGSVSNEDMIAYIKSMDGQNLDLQIVRDGTPMTVTVTPGQYDSTVSVRQFGNTGLITLTNFSENSGADFQDAVRRLHQDGVTNLIIDLRDNTGGYLKAAREIASILLPDDTVIFQEKLKDGTVQELKTDSGVEAPEFDTIFLLQNENTASASEVLIGALRDNLPDEKVVTIGTTSYGKGTEQVSVAFQDGTSLKYTVAEWLTPNGDSVNGVGLVPEEVVEDLPARLARYTLMEDPEDTFTADMVHNNAKAVQIWLQYLGYPVDRTDEYFSEQSAQALRQFEAEHGLEADGVVDKATMEVLSDAVSAALSANKTAEDPALNKALELAGQ